MPKFTSSIESLQNFDNPVVWVGAKLMIVVHVNFKEFRLIIGGADGHGSTDWTLLAGAFFSFLSDFLVKAG